MVFASVGEVAAMVALLLSMVVVGASVTLVASRSGEREAICGYRQRNMRGTVHAGIFLVSVMSMRVQGINNGRGGALVHSSYLNIVNSR